ncbi:MAG TPA: DUF4914 family protein [Anaerolineae bacterium]|nr:DUF4914 family protein [Anaerolineae bacterium]HQK13143.1 DUF4914 family protein [Anaerolineae bacterium]
MDWHIFNPPEEARRILEACPSVVVASSINELVNMACGGLGSSYTEVSYEIPDRGKVIEATVCRVRNGVAVNYPEPYMRRRDPDCLVIADDKPTDKPTFRERYGEDFHTVRQATFDWLKTQPLVIFAFTAGPRGLGSETLCIAPANAGFFALGLALLQGITPTAEIPPDFHPTAIIYVAPTFRHTHFEGKQVVVHNRLDDLHEMFSYNLYPGPSAKKGVYGMLITQGEREGWVTAHCSAVRVVTPYDNTVVIMHEGASGGGKSEMLEQAHRESDGRLLLGENIVTGEKRYLEIPRTCDLNPIADDMAVCHPAIQKNSGRLTIEDAEEAWFVRVNHIEHYGTDVYLERLTAEATTPMLFLNIDAVPRGRALIWEHIEDAPGKRCPNPRVVVPRTAVPDIVNGPVRVDIRSFGVRTPPCTRDNPTYGIIGLFHLLPPALAWLWRLVSPRGYENPSITDSNGMSSEGVGSYWPFATGRKVDQANLLLEQFRDNTRTRYILCPNQYIGAWRVGFMPQWIAREYMARRGTAPFKPEQLRPTRCNLLGYRLHYLQVEGRMITNYLTKVEVQPEVGEEAYDIGAKILTDFFHKCLKEFYTNDLLPLGRRIIECCFDGGSVTDYEALIPAYVGD